MHAAQDLPELASSLSAAVTKKKMACSIILVVVSIMALFVVSSAIPVKNKLQQLRSRNRQNAMQQYYHRGTKSFISWFNMISIITCV